MARKPSLSLAVPPAEPAAPAAAPPDRAPSRRGKKAVAAWLDPAVHQEFWIATKRAETSIQAVLEEAVAEFMRAHGARVPGS